MKNRILILLALLGITGCGIINGMTNGNVQPIFYTLTNNEPGEPEPGVEPDVVEPGVFDCETGSCGCRGGDQGFCICDEDEGFDNGGCACVFGFDCTCDYGGGGEDCSSIFEDGVMLERNSELVACGCENTDCAVYDPNDLRIDPFCIGPTCDGTLCRDELPIGFVP